MKKVALVDVQEDLPKQLRIAEEEDVLITEGDRPAGVLIGFRSEDDDLDAQSKAIPGSWRESSRRARSSGKDGASVSKTSSIFEGLLPLHG